TRDIRSARSAILRCRPRRCSAPSRPSIATTTSAGATSGSRSRRWRATARSGNASCRRAGSSWARCGSAARSPARARGRICPRGADVNAITLIVLACSAFATVYQLVQIAATRRFLGRSRPPQAGHTPPVTILKPLKGPGLELAANLETFCRQDYPEYQIVFGVEDASDPAVAVVRPLLGRFPDGDIPPSVGHEEGATGRGASLVHMMRHARHDVLVLSDADIRVRPDYLRTLVAPLADPAVGLTTCLYRGRAMLGLPSLVESLFINTDFLPMVLMAQWVQRFRS